MGTINFRKSTILAVEANHLVRPITWSRKCFKNNEMFCRILNTKFLD